MTYFFNYLKRAIWPLGEIDKFLPKEGLVYDLGCGEGLIAKYLAGSSNSRKVIGVDSDAKKLPKSNNINLRFINGDINNLQIKIADGFVISDVLHHLNMNNQRKILSKVVKSLKKNGVLIIKEIDSSEYLRSKFSRLWDFFLYPHDKIAYWNSEDLRKYLVNLGLDVQLERPSRFFPGSTTLFVCKK